jgi:1,4-dihydroxy-2-naphthoate octaprenyltransferase
VNEEGVNPSCFPALFIASRPKTLLACIIPVCLGGVLSNSLAGEFSLYLFIFTLLPALAIQVATNFFNDAIDFRKGVDTDQRLGPARMAGSGRLPPESLLLAGIAFVMIALTLGLVIVVERGLILVVIGIPSLFFTYGYTGGPFPLAYRGLGEIFVFFFFGIIAVSGTCFVQMGEWVPESFLLGAQTGLLATTLIAVNNARDIAEDKAAGKMTLAARYGLRFARIEIALLSLAPFLLGSLWWIVFDLPKVALLPLPGVILAFALTRCVWRNTPGKSYNLYLGFSILSLIAFSALFTLGLFLE